MGFGDKGRVLGVSQLGARAQSRSHHPQQASLIVLVGCQRRQAPPGLPGEGGKEKEAIPTPTLYPVPEKLSPRVSPAGKDPLLPGIFLPLSNRKWAKKRLRVLPFDPQELEARPSLTAAIPRHRAEPGSPRLPGTSREIVWSRGPPHGVYLSTRLLGECQWTGIWSGKGKPQEQGLGNVRGCGVWGAGLLIAFYGSLLLSVKVIQGSWRTEALALARTVP